MRVSAEGVSQGGSQGVSQGITLGAPLAAGLGGTDADLREDRWIAVAEASAARICPDTAFYLIGLDADGVAHPLSGTLPREAIGPRLLEVLESSVLWDRMESGRRYAAGDLATLISDWPRETDLGAVFVKDGESGLGAVLCAAERDGPGTAKDSAEDGSASLEVALQGWRLSRRAIGLRAFAGALVEAFAGGVMVLDAQGRVVYLSPTAEDILGVDASGAVGGDCTRILRPSVEAEHPLLRGLEGALETVELYVTDRRGHDVPVALTMRRMVGGAGGVQGLVCLIRNLREERSLDEEARRRERLAVIGELAAGAAHEIRNPLTGIGNCAQVLQTRLAEHEGNRKMADLILQEAQRLERIITSLLGFAHPRQPRMSECQVEEVARRALQLEQPALEGQGVRCEVRVIGRIPPIYADPEQIEQVLINLLRNAGKAMPGGGQLTVETSAVRRQVHVRRKMGRRATDRIHVPSKGPAARFVRVRVQDTGQGIPPDALTRVFDPFFTTRSDGTGLGLSISQSIIQEHGGFIGVQSLEGKGTVFEVDLPIERRRGERRREPGEA